MHTCFLSHSPGKGNRVIIGRVAPRRKIPIYLCRVRSVPTQGSPDCPRNQLDLAPFGTTPKANLFFTLVLPSRRTRGCPSRAPCENTGELGRIWACPVATYPCTHHKLSQLRISLINNYFTLENVNFIINYGGIQCGTVTVLPHLRTQVKQSKL